MLEGQSTLYSTSKCLIFWKKIALSAQHQLCNNWLKMFLSNILLFRKGNYGRVRLSLYCEAFQNIQRQKIFVHVDGVLSWRRALDNPERPWKLWWLNYKILHKLCCRGFWLFAQPWHHLQRPKTWEFVTRWNWLC